MQLIFISLNINLTKKLIWVFFLYMIHFLQLIWVFIKEAAEVEMLDIPL